MKAERTVYTVARLNRETRFLLNESFGSLWIEGEISNLAAPLSGHLYFTLKDAEAQVRCAMFRQQARFLTFAPRNGDQVLMRAQVSLYEPRGDFQLLVETLEEAGDGALMRAFEALKQRLAAEGLFDAARKKPLPLPPRCIGLMTSPTGAAVHDFLTVLRRRFPAIPVIVFPVKVQGSEARAEIINALGLAERLALCDVLVLARGGGSLEDLQAFNEESVARAIHACRIPVVSAIGHEVDFSIADFVADRRAPTPSAAAEMLSPDRGEWLERYARLEARLRRGLETRLGDGRTLLRFLQARLHQLHPAKRLHTQVQRLDELALRLERALRNRLSREEGRLATQSARLARHHPGAPIQLLERRCQSLHQTLRAATRRLLERQGLRVAELARHLHAVSPLATLERGYSITRRVEDGRILRSVEDVDPGQCIETRLAGGILLSRVETVKGAVGET